MSELRSKLLHGVQAGWDLQFHDTMLRLLGEKLSSETVYPAVDQVLRCFSYFDLVETKVVLLGQDPYIRAGEACGLSFSVPEGVKCPPSLRNMFKELAADEGVVRSNTDLENWAQQGVLLLNSALTVMEGNSNTHAYLWEAWTDEVIKKISKETTGVVFILLGNFAKGKAHYIDHKKHLVIEAGHPSPLNRKGDFAGCKMYSRTNAYLSMNDKACIKW